MHLLEHLDLDDHLGHLDHLLLHIIGLYLKRLRSRTLDLLLVHILIGFHLVDNLFVNLFVLVYIYSRPPRLTNDTKIWWTLMII